MKLYQAQWKRTKKLHFAGKCECCGKPIPKKSEAMTWNESHSWFRSDDELHTRHVKCHKKFTAPQELVSLEVVLNRITFLIERKSKERNTEPNGHTAASIDKIAKAIEDGFQKDLIGTKNRPIRTIEDVAKAMPDSWFQSEIHQDIYGWSASAIPRPSHEIWKTQKSGWRKLAATYKTEFEARARLLLIVLEVEAGIDFQQVAKTQKVQ